MLGPVIVGERVRLVPPKPEMLETFCRWFEDTEVTRYLDNIFPFSLDAEKEWFANVAKDKSLVFWAVIAADGAGERLIGTTGIHNMHPIHRSAASGNLIGEKSEWGKGYGTEVVRLRTRFAFTELNLHKISTNVYMPNIGSKRILEKAGYRTVGIAREHIWRDGKWHDAWLGEILLSDWLAAQE
jgi:RimJ/RimL family protein N-acetyltransferase